MTDHAHITTVPGVRPVAELGVGDTRIPTGQAQWDVARWDGVPEPADAVIGTGCDLLTEPFGDLDAWTQTGTPTIVAGRTGTAVRLDYNDAIAFDIPSGSQSDTITLGFAWRRNLTDNGTLARDIAVLYSDAGATVHNKLQWSPDGQLSIIRGASLGIAGSPAGSCAGTLGTWYYIEWQAKLHDTAGTMTVRVDGVEVIHATGLDTKNFGTKTVYDQVWLGTLVTAGVQEYDDFYLSTGACAFKGTLTIEPPPPPDSTWAGGEPTWLDISCFVHDLETTVGRERSIDRWQVGTATVTLDNRTGWADVDQSPLEPATLTVRPGRQIRFGVVVDDDPVRWLWRGFIDGVEPRYDPVLHDVVVLSCVDAKGFAGKVDLPTVAPVGAGETATARIGRILDAAGWFGDRDLAPTSVTVAATTLGARAVDLLDLTADSAGGHVFADVDGRVVFRARDWQLYSPDTPPDATIGNVDPAEVCPAGWETSFNLADVATRVIVGRDGEPGRVFDDLPNQTRYGVETSTYSRTDLICDEDAQLDLLGMRWLQVLSADYMPNIAAVAIEPATSTASRDLAATVDPTVPSRYRCRHHAEDGRVIFDRQFFATGVEHRIDAHTWTCRISLDDAGPYAAVGGSWDEALWDLGVWGEMAVLLAEATRLRDELIGAR